MQNQDISKTLNVIHKRTSSDAVPTIDQSYDPLAAMVIKPGKVVKGHAAIREVMSDSLDNEQLQNLIKGDSVLIEAGDVALLMAKTYSQSATGGKFESPKRSIYVFKKNEFGYWRCVVDNYFGTELLDFV